MASLFCPSCGTLMRKNEPCRGCKRGIKRTKDIESLDDKFNSAFKNDKRVARFLPKMREYQIDLLNSPRCIRGKLYTFDEKQIANVITDINIIASLKMVTVGSGRKYFEVPESVVLSANYEQKTGQPEKSYLLAIGKRDYWLYKTHSALYRYTPSANPLARFIVPSDFNLANSNNSELSQQEKKLIDILDSMDP